MRLRHAHHAAAAASVIWLTIAGLGLAQQAPPANDRPAAPKAEQLTSLAQSLDADEFFVRETAMLELLAAGPAALPALRPVLAGGSLEATSRALYVLRQLGLAATVEDRDEAGELLAELAARKETPALAARAAAALAELTQQRSEQALSELVALGAKVNHGQSVFGFWITESPTSMELGDAFQGDVQDLVRLKWLAEVPVLVLSGQRVTDAWVQRALTVQGLDELHLYRTGITADGVASLAGNETLKQIGLYYTPLGDAVLASLAKLPLLNYIKLYGTAVSVEGLQEFVRTSGIRVDYKRGAFLGVRCSDLNGACQVSSVHAGSPAEKAGLRAGDFIIRFGGGKVTNFESLQALIATRNIEEAVEMELVRPQADDGSSYQPISATVKLAPWDIDAAVQNPRR